MKEIIISKKDLVTYEHIPLYMNDLILSLLQQRGGPIIGKVWLEVEPGYLSTQEILPNGDMRFTFVKMFKTGYEGPNKLESMHYTFKPKSKGNWFTRLFKRGK